MEEKHTILFEGYLQGNLSEDQRKGFEIKLIEDSGFASDFETYKLMHLFLENKFSEERKELKKTLHAIKKEHFSKPLDTSENITKVFKLKPWHYSIAASILLFFGIYMFNFNNGVSYSDYAFSNTISLVERNTNKGLRKNAETSFNKKNYTEAIFYFNQILEEEPTSSEVLFYKGVALVEINKFEDADMAFSKLQKSNNVFKNQALFYSALSMLKQKDFKACKRILKTIPETAEDYTKAQKILKKLK